MVNCREPKTFELRHTIPGHAGRIESMCFWPNGKTLVTGYARKIFTIKRWDISAYMAE